MRSPVYTAQKSAWHGTDRRIAPPRNPEFRTWHLNIVLLFMEAKRQPPSAISIPRLVWWARPIRNSLTPSCNVGCPPTDTFVGYRHWWPQHPWHEMQSLGLAQQKEIVLLTAPARERQTGFFEGLARDVGWPPTACERYGKAEALPLAEPLETQTARGCGTRSREPEVECIASLRAETSNPRELTLRSALQAGSGSTRIGPACSAPPCTFPFHGQLMHTAWPACTPRYSVLTHASKLPCLPADSWSTSSASRNMLIFQRLGPLNSRQACCHIAPSSAQYTLARWSHFTPIVYCR